MKSLKRIPGNNLGGLFLIEFATKDSFLNIPLPSEDNTINGPVDFKNGNTWLTIESSVNGREFNEPVENTDNGPVYKISVKCFYRGIDPAVTHQLHLMNLSQFIIRVKDTNNQVRLIGNQLELLNFRYEFQTGDNPGILKGYKLEFYGDFSAPPPFYSMV